MTTKLLAAAVAVLALTTACSQADETPEARSTSEPTTPITTASTTSDLLVELAPGDPIPGFYALTDEPVTAVMPPRTYEFKQDVGMRQLSSADGMVHLTYGFIGGMYGRGGRRIDVGTDPARAADVVADRQELRDVRREPVEVAEVEGLRLTFTHRGDASEAVGGEGLANRALVCFDKARECVAPDDGTSRAYVLPWRDRMLWIAVDSTQGAPLPPRFEQRFLDSLAFG